MGKDKKWHYEVDRRHARRKRGTSKEARVQIRKGIGACIFLLGIPNVIAGIIITIVAYSRDDATMLPSSFPVLGPVLIVLATLCFVVGSIMTDVLNVTTCWESCRSRPPEEFCWKRCPRLFSLLYPDEVVRIQQRNAGLSALQTAPAKPAIRHFTEAKRHKTYSKHGVRFSSGDVCSGPTTSTSSDIATISETDEGQKHSPTSSLLSLRHFRIGPSDESTWVEIRHGPPVFEQQSYEHVTEFSDPMNGSGAVDQSEKSKGATNQSDFILSSVNRFDNQNGGISGRKSSHCDVMILQTVVNYGDKPDE